MEVELENENPSVVVEISPSPTEVVEQEQTPSEVVIEEAVETVTEATVEIARIEADRDITIAAIQADTETMHREAMTEEQRLWHDQEMTNMREQVRAAEERAEAATEALNALASPTLEETPETEELEVVPIAEISTSETQTEASSETLTEAPAKSAVDEPVEVVAVVRRKTRFL